MPACKRPWPPTQSAPPAPRAWARRLSCCATPCACRCVLTEVVFGLHGVGRLTYDALQTLDLPMLMAVVLYGAAFVVAVNAAADALGWALDPRRRAR